MTQLFLVSHGHFGGVAGVHLLLARLPGHLLRDIAISLGATVVDHVSLELLLAARLGADLVAGFSVAPILRSIFDFFKGAFTIGVVT